MHIVKSWLSEIMVTGGKNRYRSSSMDVRLSNLIWVIQILRGSIDSVRNPLEKGIKKGLEALLKSSNPLN